MDWTKDGVGKCFVFKFGSYSKSCTMRIKVIRSMQQGSKPSSVLHRHQIADRLSPDYFFSDGF